MRTYISRNNAIILLVSSAFAVGLLASRADDEPTTKTIVTVHTQDADTAETAPKAKPEQQEIVIQTVEDDAKKKPAKEVAWLGLAVQESSEALSSQLGLKRGEGLTVNFLAADSPAAKAEFHKNDVLVDLDGQILVHPMQLRKLVQMHDVGDTVKVTYFRGGKKQTIAVKLGKMNWDEASNTEKPEALANFETLQSQLNGLNGELGGMSETLSRARMDKVMVDTDINRTMEQTRKAIQDAVRRATVARVRLDHYDKDLDDLAHDGVDVDKDATVIVRNKHNSSRMVLQTDDSGTYIIESGAKTHLTARDKHGKLVFDGDIDTAAEKEKVPKEIWEKVEPMYKQSGTSGSGGN
jgi:hypothetical protein